MRNFASVHKRPMLARRHHTVAPPRPMSARLESQRQQIRNILHGPRLQAKLKVGAPGDAYDREA